MEALFIYFAKVLLCSGVMFLYYRIFLKDKTFHHYNRFYLLSILFISLVLPLIKVSYFTLDVNKDIYLIINQLQNINLTKTLDYDFYYFQFIIIGLGLGSLLFLIRLVFGLFKILQFRKQFPEEHIKGIRFYQTNLHEAPFSFFQNLFWKESISLDSEIGKQILKHEMVHIEQKHSWDILLVEIVTAVFWFNPIFYLIKKEITLIHEYLADKTALKNTDSKAFAQMLLASHFSGKQFPATSPFLSSNLKKRLTMLKKPKTKFGYARRIFALPLLFALAFFYLVNAKNTEIKATNMEIEKLVSMIQNDTIAPKKGEPTNPKISASDLDKLPTEIAAKAENGNITPSNLESPTSDKVNNPTDKDNKSTDLTAHLPKSEEDKIRAQIEEIRHKIAPLQLKYENDSEKGRKLSAELRAKGDQLRKLSDLKAWDEIEYASLNKEMDKLAAKIDGIFNSPEFNENLKLIDQNYANIDQLYAQIDKIYFDKEMQAKIDALNIHAAKSVEMLKSMGLQKLSSEAKSRAQMKSLPLDDSFKIYIDGKLSSKQQMDALDPQKIKNMNVDIKEKNNSQQKEIRIKTRK